MKPRWRRVIKLHDSNGCTRWGFSYPVGVERTAPGGGDLCSPAYLHAYTDVYQAAFMGPAHCGWDHASYADAVVEADDGTKLGCTRLIRRGPARLPEITTEQAVTAAILWALDDYDPVEDAGRFGTWAEGWLSGEDRSEAMAWAAWSAAASAAAEAAAEAAARAEAEATLAAAEAAAVAARARPDFKGVLRALGVTP